MVVPDPDIADLVADNAAGRIGEAEVFDLQVVRYVDRYRAFYRPAGNRVEDLMRRCAAADGNGRDR